MRGDYVVTLVNNDDDLSSLRNEWLALYARATGRMAAQHPAYFEAAREIAPPGRELVVVTVRQSGALVGLWPLAFSMSGGCRIACHPGIGSNEEYAGGLLIAPEANQAEVSAAAINEVRKRVDFLTAYNLQPGSPLVEALRRESMTSSAQSIVSFVSDLSGGWDNFANTKSANFRQHLGRQRRNLAKHGALVSVQDELDVIPWFFREKRNWLQKTGSRSPWVSNPDVGERFFTTLAARPDSPLKTFALKVDGDYIAAVLCLVSENRLEYYSPTYATGSELERFSPGVLVTEDCARWAAENGLDLDFRFTDFPYKQRWMSRTERFVTVRAAFSTRGMIEFYADAARRQSHRVKVRAAMTVKDYAARLKGRVSSG